MQYYEVLKPAGCRGEAFDFLLSLGWYPMGQTIFTTSHLFRDDGTVPLQVHWLRYPVFSLEDRASHRRIRRINSRFTVEVADPFAHSDELNVLYEKYIDSVDFEGYESIESATFRPGDSNIYDTGALIVRDGGKIVSCGIFHRGDSSLASILHFYDPQFSRYSPGKFLILKTLDYCRSEEIEWYYPGYVVQGNPKMDYKLFLGKDSVQYYSPLPHPLAGRWLAYDEL